LKRVLQREVRRIGLSCDVYTSIGVNGQGLALVVSATAEVCSVEEMVARRRMLEYVRISGAAGGLLEGVEAWRMGRDRGTCDVDVVSCVDSYVWAASNAGPPK
jgi:hypothetical protein